MAFESCYQAGKRLHQYLAERHWDGQGLIGPDPGPRFSYRIGRFVKSYLRAIPWRDNYYYLQAQGYWILGNWRLFALTGDEHYRDIAVRCAGRIVAQQRPDGAWEYPHPEWKGRIANFEGTWGSMGLIETYRQTGERAFLESALRWHRFQVETLGFQYVGDEIAVNYFVGRSIPRVLNNSIFMLRFINELADATGDASYMEPSTGLLTFISRAQKPTGELPYSVPGPEKGGKARPHFQCYQYNAFACLDLLRYYSLSRDRAVLPVIKGILSYLGMGVAADGHAYYDCGDHSRAVTYHAAVVAAAFARATSVGDFTALAERSYAYVLQQQRRDGSFVYSVRDYRLLSDQRSYPRYLAMIMFHLLEPFSGGGDHGPVPRAVSLQEDSPPVNELHP